MLKKTIFKDNKIFFYQLNVIDKFLQENIRSGYDWKYISNDDKKTYLVIYNPSNIGIYSSANSKKYVEDNTLTIETIKKSKKLQEVLIINNLKILEFENTNEFFNYINKFIHAYGLIDKKVNNKILILKWINKNCQVKVININDYIALEIFNKTDRMINWGSDFSLFNNLDNKLSSMHQYFDSEKLILKWKENNFNYKNIKNDLELLFDFIQEKFIEN